MNYYLLQIEKLKREIPILKKENFAHAPSGTRHKVYLSQNYAIRFQNNRPELSQRESDFLKRLDHPLIPKILWEGNIDGFGVMVESRLQGKTVDMVWRNLPEAHRLNIIEQIVQFLSYLKAQKMDDVYSVQTGKKYNNFFDCLTDNINQKIFDIRKVEQTKPMLDNLLSIINRPELENRFSKENRISIVHGDLIIHNLLTDGKNLTGVLDWEMALFGDSDYDLFRLFYYQECAKAYQELGTDETFESSYMNKLAAAILKSDLITNKEVFWSKYEFVRAIFYLNALYWAICSDNPKDNVDELVNKWNKKGGDKCFRT